MNHFHTVVFTFAFCALVGWLYEMLVYCTRERRLVPRGFLVGPFLPLYGFGGVILIYATQGVADSPLAVFLIGMAVATLCEYLAASLLEVIFKMSWWDYNDMRFNYKGVIALLPSLVWGAATMLGVYAFWPIIHNLDAVVYNNWGIMPYIVFLVLLVADATFSAIHVAAFRTYARRVKKSWKKDGELDTAKYMRFLYREMRAHSPFYSLRKLVLTTAPEHLKELWEKARKK
ncbi:MAG: putative ABC transporter permease [Candidatus Nomurabacteria bacterium]|jgi:uncharacterized membrane protein|nr:putative ABC transporter permease [Candidatus Nomurabacteria bacterium]